MTDNNDAQNITDDSTKNEDEIKSNEQNTENKENDKNTVQNEVNTSTTVTETSGDQYFAELRLERDKMYSQMLESYQKILSNSQISETQKEISENEIKKYFPRSFSARQMRNTIIKLLDVWMRNRQKKPER